MRKQLFSRQRFQFSSFFVSFGSGFIGSCIIFGCIIIS